MIRRFFRTRRFVFLAVVAGSGLIVAGVVLAVALSGGDVIDEPERGAATPVASPAPSTGTQPGQSVVDQLKAQVEAGRLDQVVFDEITAKGAAEALVVLDDDRAMESVRQLAAARGFGLDDDRIAELKPVIYAEIKRQLATAAPEHVRTVEDFESFGVAQVRFTSAQALLETLRRPEIAGVREIQQYTRPS